MHEFKIKNYENMDFSNGNDGGDYSISPGEKNKA